MNAREAVSVFVLPPLHILDVMVLASSRFSPYGPKVAASNNWG